MNFTLPHIPERPAKPRKNGLTMMMDKGLSLRQAEDFLSVSGHLTDIIKLGFGTSFVTPNLEQKIKLYKEAGMKVYLGGTLFEAFLVRNMFDDYVKLLEKLKLDCAEVSDGSIVMPHDKKCEYIHRLSKNYTVLSEVGSKEAGIIIHPAKWTSMMDAELKAGSWKVIAEARESGNVGIYRANGTAHTLLINKILAKINKDDILWEAPIKGQQIWFIKLLGPNVNLGNISYDDVIPLETLRLGLRGDTFLSYLPAELKQTTEVL
jgi:phosphosulfolactate synthase